MRELYVTFSLFSSDSQKHIDFLQKQFLDPIIEKEKKTRKIIIPNKDRKTLEKIYGIIETNATYLTPNNSIAGKFWKFKLKVNKHEKISLIQF